MMLHFDSKIILIGLFCLSAYDGIIAFEPSNVLPCDYADSVNITSGILQPNNSYIFNGVEYPKDHYAKIRYSILNNEIIPRPPYIRGCLCNVKNCIRFCCPYGSYLEIKNGVGRCRPHKAAKFIDGEIVNENNQTQRIKLHEHFAILHKYPCENIRVASDEYAITHVSLFGKLEQITLNKLLFPLEWRCCCAKSNVQST